MLPEIEAERLILRPPKLGDEKPLNQAINRSLPELQRWMPWADDPACNQPLISLKRLLSVGDRMRRKGYKKYKAILWLFLRN